MVVCSLSQLWPHPQSQLRVMSRVVIQALTRRVPISSVQGNTQSRLAVIATSPGSGSSLTTWRSTPSWFSRNRRSLWGLENTASPVQPAALRSTPAIQRKMFICKFLSLIAVGLLPDCVAVCHTSNRRAKSTLERPGVLAAGVGQVPGTLPAEADDSVRG